MVTHKTRFRFFPYLLLASIAFFLPLTSHRVYETAYELSFTGINKCMLHATLAITAFLLAIWICGIPNFRFRIALPVSAAISLAF